MKTLRKIIEWCDELNDSTIGDILVWVFFIVDFIALWFLVYMMAG